MASKKRYPRTKAQREFRREFQGELLFDFMDDTTEPFSERVKWNINWVREHVSDRTMYLEKQAWLIERTGDTSVERKPKEGEIEQMATERVLCPECGAEMVLRETKKFKWKNGVARLFYGCSRWPECNGTHGAHPDGKPLGVPANAATKKARSAAHAAFDVMMPRFEMSKKAAYRWLGRELGIPDAEIAAKCHIAMFDAETCGRVVEICSRADTGPSSPSPE